ncbi:MAG TPA: hypothetical protein GX707_00145 [Epulopiscium sp.]|nr:hypothetical protein [Candidatus Epulonipiscium sp.]
MKLSKECYERKYLGNWDALLEERRKAYNLRIEYEYKCEMYDRQISRGRNDEQGFVFLTSKELCLSRANALRVDRILRQIAKNENIDSKLLSDAKREVSRLTFSELEREYLFIQEHDKLLMV